MFMRGIRPRRTDLPVLHFRHNGADEDVCRPWDDLVAVRSGDPIA